MLLISWMIRIFDLVTNVKSLYLVPGIHASKILFIIHAIGPVQELFQNTKFWIRSQAAWVILLIYSRPILRPLKGYNRMLGKYLQEFNTNLTFRNLISDVLARKMIAYYIMHIRSHTVWLIHLTIDRLRHEVHLSFWRSFYWKFFIQKMWNVSLSMLVLCEIRKKSRGFT